MCTTAPIASPTSICAKRRARPVDLWTTLKRVLHRVHRRNNNSSQSLSIDEQKVSTMSPNGCQPCLRSKYPARGEGERPALPLEGGCAERQIIFMSPMPPESSGTIVALGAKVGNAHG